MATSSRNLLNSHLECKDGVALRCDGMHVKGSLRLGDPDPILVTDDAPEVRRTGRRAEITGEVRLVKANIENDANFTHVQIKSRGTALNGERVAVKDALFLDEGFESVGSVRLLGAKVTRLNCTGGKFSSERGPAIDASGLEATDVYFNTGENAGIRDNGKFRAKGGVQLVGASVSRQVCCSGAEMTGGDGDGTALMADRLNCGALYLNKSFLAEGSVSLWGATIKYVDLRGATIRVAGRAWSAETKIPGYRLHALDLAETNVEGHVLDSTRESKAASTWPTRTYPETSTSPGRPSRLPVTDNAPA